MRTLMVVSIVASTLVTSSLGLAQPADHAAPAAPADPAPAAALAARGGDAPAATAPSAQPPAAAAAPGAGATALRHSCESAMAAAKQAGDNLFINDVSNVAAGAMSREELAKSSEGAQCLGALDQNPEFRQSAAVAANEAAANERLALVKKDHEDAALAIAKNERHVILAYAALWLLAAAFVIFLWRRQQLLKSEIAQLRSDLEAASK